MSYYKSQLSKVNFQSEFPARVQFMDERGKTKVLNVNKESAQSIIDKLKKDFDL